MAKDTSVYEITLGEDGVAVLRQLSDSLKQFVAAGPGLIAALQPLGNLLGNVSSSGGRLTLSFQKLNSALEDNIALLLQQNDAMATAQQNQPAGAESADENGGSGGGAAGAGGEAGAYTAIGNAINFVNTATQGYGKTLESVKTVTDVWSLMNGKAAASVEGVGEESLTSSPLVEGLALALDITPEGLLLTIGGIVTGLLNMGDSANTANYAITELDEEASVRLEHLRKASGESSKIWDESFGDRMHQINEDRKKQDLFGGGQTQGGSKYPAYHPPTPAEIYADLYDSESVDELAKLNSDFESKYKISLQQAAELNMLTEAGVYNPFDPKAGITDLTVDKEIYTAFVKNQVMQGNTRFTNNGAAKPLRHSKPPVHTLPKLYSMHAPAGYSAAGSTVNNNYYIQPNFTNSFGELNDSLKYIHDKVVEVLVSATHDASISPATH